MDKTCFIPDCHSKSTQIYRNGVNDVYFCLRHLQDLSSGNHNVSQAKKEHADSIAYIHQKNKELENINKDLEKVDAFIAKNHIKLNVTHSNIKIISDIYKSIELCLESQSKDIERASIIPGLKKLSDPEIKEKVDSLLKKKYEELNVSIRELEGILYVVKIKTEHNEKESNVDYSYTGVIPPMKRHRDYYMKKDLITENTAIKHQKKAPKTKKSKKIGDSLFHFTNDGKLMRLNYNYEHNNYEVGGTLTLQIGKKVDKYISMCLYRGNIFCYGNKNKNTITGLTLAINTSNFNVTEKCPGHSVYLPGLIYADNYFLAFGGFIGNEETTDIASRFDLSSDKWVNIRSIPEKSAQVSCFYLNESVYLSGFHHSKVYCYSPADSDYKQVLEVKANMNKIITGTSGIIYVIECNGYIYQSSLENLGSFRVVSSANIEMGQFFGLRTVLDNYSYFGLGKRFYKFDLNQAKIEPLSVEINQS